MERMTLKRCFIDSWGMALNAVVSRPVEVAGLFAILYVVNFIELTFWAAALGTSRRALRITGIRLPHPSMGS